MPLATLGSLRFMTPSWWQRSHWLIALVLFPVAGLIALSVLGLQAAVRDAEDQVRAASIDRARSTARVLRDFLHQPDFLGRLPEKLRFERREGQWVIPPAVSWLEPPPETFEDPRESISIRSLRWLEEARRAEFGERDALTALHRATDLVVNQESEPAAARAWLLLQAAWIAWRQGDDRHRAWTASLDRLVEGTTPDALTVVGRVLLAGATRQRLPAWAETLFLQLPPALAGSTLDELHLHEDVPFRRDLARRLAAVIERRTLLRRVSAAQVDWSAQTPFVQREGERLLMYWPENAGSGAGAWVTPADLASILEQSTRSPTEESALEDDLHPLTTVPGDGRVVAGFVAPPRAIAIEAGLWVLPLEGDEPLPIWARPGAALAVLVALAILLGLGLGLSARALRREALAARTRADFLTSITHELRTPLASIRLFAEMLAEGRAGSEGQQREYLELLGGEAARLSVLVENVLDLGRAERGERGYDRRRQEIGPCLEHIASVFAPLARRDGLELAVQVQDPATHVELDSEALTQAVLNVLENARRYGADGGRIRLLGHRLGDVYRIEIEDEGPGIARDEREAIFAPFRRGAANASGTVPGLGVGLSLSRTILRAHAGDLELDDAERTSGACFVASLPVACEDEVS